MIPDNLIINADDFGLNARVNAAIVKSFNVGLINSTSIMVNMPGYLEAVKLAKENRFQDKIGLHVCLTQGIPLSEFSGTGFIKKNGEFSKTEVYKPSVFLNSVSRQSIKKEIKAQLDSLKEKGIIPTHINTHHDIHELPWLFPLFIKIARKNHIELRISQTWNNGTNPVKPLYRKMINRVYKTYNLNYSDYFEVLQTVSPEHFYNSKKTEIMIHPDLNENGEIVDSFDGIYLEKHIRKLLDNLTA